MAVCPACRHVEKEGELFCTHCGAYLASVEGSSSEADLQPDHLNFNFDAEQPKSDAQVKPKFDPSIRVTLQVLSTGDQLPLKGKSEFTLGRISGTQPILPDIDLTPYQAYETGVSRLHALLLLDLDKITITDLGSANGTRINGDRVTAHAPYPLQDGDIISLGNFKACIYIRDL